MSLSNIPRSYLTNMSRASGLRSTRNASAASLKSGGLLQLKSGSLTSGLSSLGGMSLMNRSSIRSAVSQAVRSDVSDVSAVSEKVSGGMTQDYVSALEAQAREDAQAGVYGKDGKAGELRASQMEKYVSPDRDSAIAQANKLLSSSSTRGAGTSTAKLSGLPYTVSITRGLSGTTAELYDENGEKFASYNSRGGGWSSVATKAESQFQTASSTIYDEAYRAAQSGGDGDTGGSSGLNTRA